MRVFRIWTAFVLAVVAQVSVAAQQTSDFVPVEPGTQLVETLPAAPMVMTAYALVWLLLMGYVWSLRRRQARVELELAALREKLPAARP